MVPFFEDADPQFVSCIVARLQFEVYQPGDFVITEGTIGTKMFFILQGTVEVITSHSSTPVAQLTDGAYFGGKSPAAFNYFLEIGVGNRNIYIKSV